MDKNNDINNLNYYTWLEINIFLSKNPYSNIILLPWLPNLGIEKDNKIINYFNNNWSNLIFLDDKSKWLSLYEDTNKLINLIKKWNLEWINKSLPIFLIGLSFWWWIAIKIAKNNSNILHTFALSPLTKDTCWNIDWEWLFYIVNDCNNFNLHKNILEFKENILSLLTIEWKIPEKLSIFWIDSDTEIKIPESYNPNILNNSDIWINHFWLRKTAQLRDDVKNEIFRNILKYNLYKGIQKDFIQYTLNIFGKENIYWIYTHWTSAFYLEKDQDNIENDVDFILCLKNNSNWVSEKLTNLIWELKNKYHNLNFDISLFFYDTINKIWLSNIVTSTHWPVYSLVFWNAKILYWNNIFLEANNLFSKEEITKSFILEIWKYIDRLNREFLKWDIKPEVIRKYTIRIIMSYMISRWDLSISQSNFFWYKSAIKYMEDKFKDFLYIKLFIKIINWDKFDINKAMDWLNLFLKEYWSNDFDNVKIIDNNINRLKQITSISWYKSTVYIPEEKFIPEEVLWISCLWFSSINTLSRDIRLNKEQLEKNLISWLTIEKVKNFLFNTYWLEVWTWLKIWDFWLKILWDSKENAKIIAKWQSYLEKELKKYLANNGKISRLSSDFSNNWERKFSTLVEYDEINTDKFLEILSSEKYNLPKEFIENYIWRYFNKNWDLLLNRKQLEIIYSSIQEHLELWYRISQKWKNKIFVFIWNEKKISLITEVLKSKKSNNIMIWLSEEKNIN